MSPYKTLKTAADTLEAVATERDDLAVKLAKAEATVLDLQTKAAAAEKQTKVAAESDKADKAKLAKIASDKLVAAGLLQEGKKADEFAAQILDHKTALAKLAHLTQFASAPKTATVVIGGGEKPQTADERWDQAAQTVLARTR